MTELEAIEFERLKIAVRLYEQSNDALVRELAATRVRNQFLEAEAKKQEAPRAP